MNISHDEWNALSIRPRQPAFETIDYTREIHFANLAFHEPSVVHLCQDEILEEIICSMGFNGPVNTGPTLCLVQLSPCDRLSYENSSQFLGIDSSNFI